MVIAADTSSEMLLALNRRVPGDNVQVLEVEEVKLDIEDESVDGVVTITVFHEFKKPSENLVEIYRVLKPGGKLMIIDWKPDTENMSGPSQSDRVFVDDAHKIVEEAGFSIIVAEPHSETKWIIIAGK